MLEDTESGVSPRYCVIVNKCYFIISILEQIHYVTHTQQFPSLVCVCVCVCVCAGVHYKSVV